jgi:hypothetical protein
MYPALIGIPCVLVLGLLTILALKFEGCSFSSMLFTGCACLCLAGVLLVIAFARYQFSHLWRHPDPAFSKKRELKTAERRTNV